MSPANVSPASLDSTAIDAAPGFAARGRLRRRVRFLRKARELAYRDLGGLVYNLHRFGQRNDQLVLGKLTTLGHLDTELRTLESALGERQAVTVLREAGLTACPRCAAIHGSEDRFCPNCGLPLSRNVDLPIAGPPTAPAMTGAPAPGPAAAPPAHVQAPTGAPTDGVTTPPGSTAGAARAPGTRGAAAPGGRAPVPPAAPPPAPQTPPAGSAATREHTDPARPVSAPAERAADDQPTEVVRPTPRGA
jgi:hypothetical protein